MSLSKEYFKRYRDERNRPGILLRELPTAGWYGLDGGDLLAEVRRKAKMLLDDMC
jgi:hypothetical protein